MSDLQSTLTATLIERYLRHAKKIHELASPLADDGFWRKPFPFGNSFGHLILHLTGNLNYYIGAQIAGTGYLRDREREFTEKNRPSKEETLKGLDDAVQLVVQTIETQSSDDWLSEYTAAGATARNRLEMVAHCAGHMQLHIGQMIYLGYELKRQAVIDTK